MSTPNAERLAKYREKMKAAGFKRLSFYVSGELAEYLEAERQPHECGGRVLERLLLGESAPRPEYWTLEERRRKNARSRGSSRL